MQEGIDGLQHIRALPAIECGHEAARHFAFAPGYRNLDHGAYGTYPRPVRDVFRAFQDETEAQPNTFIRYRYRTHLLQQSRKVIADYLNAPIETCVYLPNTSNGIDTILRNLIYRPGDVVVCFDTIYLSFAYTLQYLKETTPVDIVKIPYSVPISDDRLCELFENTIRQIRAEGRTPRLAIFDTLNSLPCVRMPFERLTQICKKVDVLSCIDGAHGVGHLPLDMSTLDPDFFVSNCHKWLFVPRSCAVLYVPVRNQGYLRATLPIGFYFKTLPDGSQDDKLPVDPQGFVANFSSLGTLDDTPYLCVEAALLWRSKLTWKGEKGEDAIFAYLQQLAVEGARLVATMLQTDELETFAGPAALCGVRNVRLPLKACATAETTDADLNRICGWIQGIMTLEHGTAVTTFVYARVCWVRLFAQVYLTMQDFEAVAVALKEVCHRADRDAWRQAAT